MTCPPPPTESPPFAAESDEALMLAIFTAHPQESVVESTAFEKIYEFLLNKGG